MNSLLSMTPAISFLLFARIAKYNWDVGPSAPFLMSLETRQFLSIAFSARPRVEEEIGMNLLEVAQMSQQLC